MDQSTAAVSVGPIAPRGLRAPKIAAVRKTIRYADAFRDYTGKADQERYASDFEELLRRIGEGLALPDRFYRTGFGKGGDELLEIEGVKHLHLGGRNSDVLIYLVEYEHVVQLLEINDHKAFSSKPIGHLLRANHSTHNDEALANDQRELTMEEKKARRAVSRRPSPPGV